MQAGEADGLNLLCDAATDYAERRLNRSLGTQTLRATYYPGDGEGRRLKLPRGPVQSVESITDEGGEPLQGSLMMRGALDELTLSRPIGSHADARVVVDYIAGEPELPAALKVGLLAHVAWLYEQRLPAGKAGDSLPHHLDALYAAHCRSDVILSG